MPRIVISIRNYNCFLTIFAKFAGYIGVLSMRKGIKILGKVFSAAVLLLIILPMALSLLLDIPAVQNYVVQKAVRMVSQEARNHRVASTAWTSGIFSEGQGQGFLCRGLPARHAALRRAASTPSSRGWASSAAGWCSAAARSADARLYLRETPERGDEHQADRQPHQRPRQTQEGQFPPAR